MALRNSLNTASGVASAGAGDFSLARISRALSTACLPLSVPLVNTHVASSFSRFCLVLEDLGGEEKQGRIYVRNLDSRLGGYFQILLSLGVRHIVSSSSCHLEKAALKSSRPEEFTNVRFSFVEVILGCVQLRHFVEDKRIHAQSAGAHILNDHVDCFLLIDVLIDLGL